MRCSNYATPLTILSFAWWGSPSTNHESCQIQADEMCFCHNRRILLKKHCLDPPLKKLYFNFKKVRLLTAIINANVNTDSLPISISLSITLLSFSVFSIVTCAATAMVAWNRFLKRRPRVSIFVIAWFFLLRIPRCQTQLKLSSLRFMNSCMIV